MKITENIFTLWNKLVLLFLILALVPLAIIGVFSIHNTEDLVGNLVLRQLENLAQDKAAILERWLEERKQDMQVIAGTSIVKSMSPGDIRPYLELIQSHYGVYKGLTVVYDASEIIISTQAEPRVFEPGEWDPSAGKGSLIMSGIFYFPEQKESVFHIAAPVYEGDTRIGMIYGTVGTSKIIYIILGVTLGRTGECYLVDRNGTFLAHKEPHRILSENISQSESFKNIFDPRDRRQTYLDYRNIEVLGTSRQVKGTDWFIVVEQDREEAFESVTTLKHYIFFTILLAISSALVLTWVISYHIVGPIRTLSRSAHTLAAATHDPVEMVPVETSRRDEIGVLCRAFADMALKIRERQNHLEQEFSLKEAQLKETDQTLKQVKLIAERSERFAALGRLGAAVAHEIRTPLTSLKLFLESVQAEIEISPEYAEDFSVAMGQMARIEGAINRLLDYTKPKDPLFANVQVPQLITGVVSMVRPMATKQECALDVRVKDDLPEIYADRKLLEEALINLIINSLEAVAGPGRIVVTAAPDILKTGRTRTACVRINIQDSGPGIPDKHVHLIFEPFFTTKSAGTGLGLPMVLNTIKRHKGEVRVESGLDKGTVFSIYLPIRSNDK